MNKPCVGFLCLSNFGGLCIEAINYGIDDSVTHYFDFGNGQSKSYTSKIRYTNPRNPDADCKPYFISRGRRYYLDEFMRTEG